MKNTRNLKTLLAGIFSTRVLTNDDEHLSTLYDICKIVKDTKELDSITLNNFLISKNIPSNDGSLLLYSSLFIFSGMINDDSVASTDVHALKFYLNRLVKNIVTLTDSSSRSYGVILEYIMLLHDLYCNLIKKEDIFEILPEIDVLEDELIVNDEIPDIFFIALWCFVMTDSYKQACEKAVSISSNYYIVEIVGALSGLYYGLESIPTNWRITSNDVFDLDSIIF